MIKVWRLTNGECPVAECVTAKEADDVCHFYNQTFPAQRFTVKHHYEQTNCNIIYTHAREYIYFIISALLIALMVGLIALRII